MLDTKCITELKKVRHQTHLRVMADGNMNDKHAAAVAPVNWNISQMLGMKFAPKKEATIRTIVIDANLKLSRTKGLDDGNMRPSRLIRTA